VFGPQKGATPEQVALLEHGLEQLAYKAHRTDLINRPGAGAAGGLGFGMMAFFNASLVPGIEVVMETLKLRERLKGTDLCLTGEGRFDEQSAYGKTPVGVARLCKELAVPCVVVAGSIGHGADRSAREGVAAVFAASDGPHTLEDAMSSAPELVASTVEQIVRLWRSKA
jgi:glycerate kinase